MADLVAEWSCVQRLFTVFDKSRSRALNLDQLVDFVAEVRKMDIVPVDEAYIVAQLQQSDLEEITCASRYRAPPAAPLTHISLAAGGNASLSGRGGDADNELCTGSNNSSSGARPTDPR